MYSETSSANRIANIDSSAPHAAKIDNKRIYHVELNPAREWFAPPTGNDWNSIPLEDRLKLATNRYWLLNYINKVYKIDVKQTEYTISDGTMYRNETFVLMFDFDVMSDIMLARILRHLRQYIHACAVYRTLKSYILCIETSEPWEFKFLGENSDTHVNHVTQGIRLSSIPVAMYVADANNKMREVPIQTSQYTLGGK